MLRKILFTLSLLVLLSSCSCEMPTEGAFGQFALSLATEQVEMVPFTRAVATDQFQVNLSHPSGAPLISGRAISAMQTADFVLPVAAHYHIMVESCTDQEAETTNAGWGSIHYRGETTFDIQDGATAQVGVNCQMVNAGLKVVFDDSFTAKFPYYSATTTDTRALAFRSTNPGAVAYYNIEAGNAPMLNLRLTGSGGTWDDYLDKEQAVSLMAGKIVVLTVKYAAANGGANMEIDTDTTVDIDDQNEVILQ